MQKYFQILRKCSLFSNIADENLIPMLSCLNARVIKYGKGEDIRNMFGEKLQRFYYHYASVSGNTPYSSRTDCLISEEDNAYQYKLVKVKKIKRLG